MYLKTVDRITVDSGETKHGLHGPFYIPRGRKQYHMRTKSVEVNHAIGKYYLAFK